MAETSSSTFSYPPEVWEAIKRLLARGEDLSNQPYTPYEQDRVAPLTPQHQAAIDMITKRAQEGDPGIKAAQGFSQGMLSGQYLNNPFLSKEAVDRVVADNAALMGKTFAEGTAASNAALANRQGAFGGSGYQLKQTADAEALARATGQMANQAQLGYSTLGAGDYRTGTNQMLQAGNLAQGLSGEDYRAAQMLAGAGDISRDVSQQGLEAQYQEFLRKQGYPYAALNTFGGTLANAGGQGTTTQTQPGASPWATGIGLGSVLAGILWPSKP